MLAKSTCSYMGMTFTGLALLGGCPGSPWVQPETPPELAQVIDKAAEFLVSSARDPAAPPPGSPGDSLDALSGCWGAVWPAGYEGVPVTVHSVYQFELAEGRFTQWALQVLPLAPLLPTVLSVDSGTFEFLAEGSDRRVRLTIAEVRTNDPPSGQLVTEVWPTDADPWVRDILVTIRGDQLHLWEASAGDPPDNGAWWIYRRFDCPE